MSQQSPWKPLAIILAVALVVVLVCVVLVLADVMTLTQSLL